MKKLLPMLIMAAALVVTAAPEPVFAHHGGWHSSDGDYRDWYHNRDGGRHHRRGHGKRRHGKRDSDDVALAHVIKDGVITLVALSMLNNQQQANTTALQNGVAAEDYYCERQTDATGRVIAGGCVERNAGRRTTPYGAGRVAVPVAAAPAVPANPCAGAIRPGWTASVVMGPSGIPQCVLQPTTPAPAASPAAAAPTSEDAWCASRFGAGYVMGPAGRCGKLEDFAPAAAAPAGAVRYAVAPAYGATPRRGPWD